MAVIKIDTTQYDAQLSEKEQRITSQFRRFGVEKLEVFGSDPIHYRQRAEFRVWHEGDEDRSEHPFGKRHRSKRQSFTSLENNVQSGLWSIQNAGPPSRWYVAHGCVFRLYHYQH